MPPRAPRLLVPLLAALLTVPAAAGPAVAQVPAEAPATTVALPPMTSPRSDATLTTLPDGRLLALGGDYPASATTATRADLFDPLTRTWRATSASPQEHRTGHAAVALADGRVLVVGGSRTGGYGPDREAALYDPASDSWSSTAAPPFLSQRAAAVLLADGRVLLTGGSDADGLPVRDTALYDATTQTWSASGPTTTGHPAATAVRLPGGDVLLSGGSAQVERWSAATGTWGSATPDEPEHRRAQGLAALPGGEVLAVAVDDAATEQVGAETATEVYDPDRRSFRYAGDVQLERPTETQTGGPVVALPDGQAVLVGVAQGGPPQGVLVRDPAAQVWRDGGRLQKPRSSLRAAAVPGGVVVIGGVDGPDASVELVPLVVGDPPPSDRGRPGRQLELSGNPVDRGHVVTGHLLVDGEGRAGEPVELWRRSPRSRDWTRAQTADTLDGGLVSFDVAGDPAVWALRHRSTAGVAAAASHDLFLERDQVAREPAAPELLGAEAGQQEVRASWIPPSRDLGRPITGYTVRVTDAVSHRVVAAQDLGPDAREAVLDVPEGRYVTVQVQTRTDGEGYGESLGSPVLHTEPGRRLSDDPPGRPSLCGRLPRGLTVVDGRSGPVSLCRTGAVVEPGSALVLDASAGPVDVVAAGAGGLSVPGGELRTRGTAPDRRVRFRAAGTEQPWQGVVAGVGRQRLAVEGTSSPSLLGGQGVLDLSDTDLLGSREGLRVRGRALRTRLRGVTVRDVQGTAVDVQSTGVDVAGLDVRGAGVALSCTDAFDSPPCTHLLRDVRVDGAVGTALRVAGSRRVVLTGASVTGTRAPAAGKAVPSVVLDGVVLRAGDPAPDVTGGGGPLDVVLLSAVRVEGDLRWRGDLGAPFGWVHGGLTMAPGARLVVPRDQALVAVDSGPATSGPFRRTEPVVLDAAALQVEEGGVLTAASDPELPGGLCRSSLATSCAPRAGLWAGVRATGASTVRLTGAALRYAGTALQLQPGRSATPELTVELDDTEIGPAFEGVVGGPEDRPQTPARVGTLRWDGGSLHDVGSAVSLYGLRSTVVRDVAVRDAGLVRVGARSQREETELVSGRPAAGAVELQRLLLERTGGLEVAQAEHPVVRDVTVRGTRQPISPGPLRRAVTFDQVTASYGQGQDVDGLRGRDNAVDAVALSGSLSGPLTWRTPVRTTGDDADLGMVLGPGVLRLGTQTLTVPAGGVVKADPSGGIDVGDGALSAVAGGAVLTSTGDDTVGARTCARSCDRTWGGVSNQFGLGSVALRDARVRGGRIGLSGRPASRDALPTQGSLVLESVDSDSPVGASEIATLTVVDSRTGPVSSAQVASTRLERDRTARVAVDHTPVTGLTAPPYALALHDVAALDPAGPGFRLTGVRTGIGTGQAVDGLTGRGQGGVLVLAGVRLTSDLDWVTPSTTGDLHPVGYVAPALDLEDGRALTLHAGDVVKLGRLRTTVPVRAAGAVGAVVTSIEDDTVGVPTCRYQSGSPCPAPSGVLVLAGTTPGQTQTLRGVDVRSRLQVEPGGPALDVAASSLSEVLTGGAVTLGTSTVNALRSSGGAVTLTDVALRPGRYDPVLDVVGGRLTANDVTAVGPANASKVRLTAGAAATVSCADVQGGRGGILLQSRATLSLRDSTLTGGSGPGSFDLDNDTTATSTGVWWGQAGGPAAGQVARRDLLVDVMPAGAPPACAGGVPVTVPRPASAVGTTPLDRAARVSWTPSPDPRATGYAVEALPSGTRTLVEPNVTSTTVRDLAPGTTVRFRVVTLTPAGDVPSVPGPAVVPADGGPVVRDLVVPPVLGPGAVGQAVVSASAQPGVRVRFSSGPLSAEAVAGEDGTARAVLDVRTRPDGDLDWTAQGTDAEGTTGPAVSASGSKDTTGPALTDVVVTPTALRADDTALVVTASTEPGAEVSAGLVSTTFSESGSGRRVPADGAGRVRLVLDPRDNVGGTLRLTLRADDLLGNSTTQSRTVEHSYPVPGLALDRSPGAVQRDTARAVRLSGSVGGTDGSAVLRVAAPGGQAVEARVSDGRFDVTLDLLPLPDGPLAVTVVRSDGTPSRAEPFPLLAGPPAVSDLVVVPVDGGYDVSWRAGPDDAAHPVTGYGVAVSPRGGTVTVAGTTARVRGRAQRGGEVTVVARSGQVPGPPARATVDEPAPAPPATTPPSPGSPPTTPAPSPTATSPSPVAPEPAASSPAASSPAVSSPTPTPAPAPSDAPPPRPAGPPPTTSIVSGPAEGAYTGRTVVFGTRADGPGTRTCRLDAASAVCGDTQTYRDLPAGSHVFSAATGDGPAVSRSFRVDAAAPTSRLTAPAVDRQTSSTGRFAATATDTGGSGVASYDVRVRTATSRAGFGAYALPARAQGGDGRLDVTLAAGSTTCGSARARDRAGNVGAWSAERCVARPLDDRSLTRSRGWTSRNAAGPYAGTTSVTSTKGATLTSTKVRGARLALLAPRCPTCGSVEVLVAGKRIGTVSLAGKAAPPAFLALPPKAMSGVTVTVRVLTSGKRVELDGLLVAAR